MKFKFASFFTALVAVLALSAASFAQDTKATQDPNSSQPTERRGGGRFGDGDKWHKRGGEHHKGGVLRAFSELNLTDSQKQQITSIVEANKASIQPQRDELRQLMMARRSGTALTPEQETRAREIGSQLRESGKKMNDDLIAILTPEQQQQLKQKRDEMRQKMQEHRQMKRQNNDTTTTPQDN
jgi:Spy/CpxP family protein refolding chaperone